MIKLVHHGVTTLLGLIVAFSSCLAQNNILPEGIIDSEVRAAPSLKLSDSDGEPFDLADSRGRWVFVHFWASWCGPCRREMPTIQLMSTMMQNTPLSIVLVNTAESEDEVFNFLGIVAPDLNTLMDRDGLVTEKWQPRGLPATFLVDPSGHIQYTVLGGRAWDKPEYVNFLLDLIDTKQ